MRNIFGLTCGFSLLFMASSLWAGAWTQPKGGVYLQASAGVSLPTKRFFDSNETLQTHSERIWRSGHISLYGEYGFSEKWTGIFSLPGVWFSSQHLSDASRNSKYLGTSPIGFGLKRLLHKGRGVLSFQLDGRVPLSFRRSEGSALANQPHAFGDGQLELHPKLLYGASLGRLYLGTELGYIFRDELPSNLIQSGFQVGGFGKRFGAELGFSVLAAAPGRPAPLWNPQNDPFLDTTSLWGEFRVTPKLFFALSKHNWIFLEYSGALLGRASPATHTFSIGWAFKK